MYVRTVKEYFDTLAQRFVSNAAKALRVIFQYEIGGDGGGVYHVIVDHGKFEVGNGPSQCPTTTFKVSAENFVKLANGEINPAMAYMKGQLKVSGNVLYAQKVDAIFLPGKGK